MEKMNSECKGNKSPPAGARKPALFERKSHL